MTSASGFKRNRSSVMKIQYTIQNVITIGRVKISPLINCVRREMKIARAARLRLPRIASRRGHAADASRAGRRKDGP